MTHHLELHTLAGLLAHHATVDPERIAVRCEEREVSYAELNSRSSASAAALLAAGLGPGDRVAYLGKESELYYELLFACAKSGLVLVPVNWRLTVPEVSHILRDSGTTVVFVDQSTSSIAEAARASLATDLRIIALSDFTAWRQPHAGVAPVHHSGPEDPIAQLYTSGTTGLPKGVVLPQRSFFAVRDALASEGLDWIDFRPGDVSLIGIPGFHVGGLWWALQGFNAGITNLSMPTFESTEAVGLINQYQVSVACVVPVMLQMMIDEAEAGELSSLRKVVYGGAPISESLLQRCLEVIGCDFAQIYGLTETGNTAVCLPPAQHIPGGPRMQAAGRPYPGFAIKVIDENGKPLPVGEVGEICIRTPAAMLEYWRLPEATAQTLIDGWIHTGDAGRLDEEGYVFVSDRIKDTIIVAGENVYPAEVENVLSRHPAVKEAAVIGRPDDLWGEAVHAVVVLKPDHSASARVLMVSLREQLADFKVPTSYEFIAKLPRNPSGKVLRRDLRDKFWQNMSRQVN